MMMMVSRGSKAFSSVCDSLCLSLFVCIKTKTAENKNTKLCTGLVQSIAHQLILG